MDICQVTTKLERFWRWLQDCGDSEGDYKVADSEGDCKVTDSEGDCKVADADGDHKAAYSEGGNMLFPKGNTTTLMRFFSHGYFNAILFPWLL